MQKNLVDSSSHLRLRLLDGLFNVLAPKPGIAIIHSSLSRIIGRSPLQPWDVLHAVQKLIDDGWTLLFPAFTFSFCSGRLFDPTTSPSETGILADMVRSRIPGAERTCHPIYSFVAAGPQKEQILNLKPKTTFGKGSVFEFAENEDATIIMLGCGWEYNTLFHRYEELAHVPYRFMKAFEGRALSNGEEVPVSADMYVRDLVLDPQNEFASAVSELRDNGSIKSCELCPGIVEAASAKKIAGICRKILAKDPLAFLSNAAAVRYRLRQRQEAKLHQPLRVWLLGSSNVDLTATTMQMVLSELMPDRDAICRTVPFGQMHQSIFDYASPLNTFGSDFSIFCDRLEDLIGQARLHDSSFCRIDELVEDYASVILRHAQDSGARVIVNLFCDFAPTPVVSGAKRREHLIRANEILTRRLSEEPTVTLLDILPVAVAAQGLSDDRTWFAGRIAFKPTASNSLSRLWTSIILSKLGKTARLVVVDLDNTLWGGVIGEDGLKGIKVGGDYPGNVFKAFQRELKALSEQGIALALCSKNDEDIAMQALQEHKEMILRPDDFVTYRINWQPKHENIQSMAEELNLGLQSIVFIDDNPVERENVRKLLPEVKVLELPTDPVGYAHELLTSPWLQTTELLEEDIKRASSYKNRRKIEAARANASNIEDFLTSLDLQLHLQPLNSSNLSRATQLCSKTNQFNTTTIRYSESDLIALRDRGADIVVLGLADKYNEVENIGLLVLDNAPDIPRAGLVNLFLLSCRVLGRDVESVVMRWARNRASLRNWKKLYGEIRTTPRNSPVRSVFQDNEFEWDESRGLWFANPLATFTPPAWFTVYDMTPPLNLAQVSVD